MGRGRYWDWAPNFSSKFTPMDMAIFTADDVVNPVPEMTKRTREN